MHLFFVGFSALPLAATTLVFFDLPIADATQNVFLCVTALRGTGTISVVFIVFLAFRVLKSLEVLLHEGFLFW